MAARWLLALTLLLPVAGLGCRSCQSCYDYSSPVAGDCCGCNSCGSRTGSATGGTMPMEYSQPAYETVQPEMVEQGAVYEGPVGTPSIQPAEVIMPME